MPALRIEGDLAGFVQFRKFWAKPLGNFVREAGEKSESTLWVIKALVAQG
jgi:hypothetical protein